MSGAREPDPVEEKAQVRIEDVAQARLAEEDLWKILKESLSLWSWTGIRLGLIMFVQGCNQAGFGIDWGVISGINAIPHGTTILVSAPAVAHTA